MKCIGVHMTDKQNKDEQESTWQQVQLRAQMCQATFLRTDPADGPRRYLCSWGDAFVFYTFFNLEDVQKHLLKIEADFAAYEASKEKSRPFSAAEHQTHQMWAKLGALSTTISTLAKQLSGEMPISRSKLIMAEAERRNYLSELEARHAKAVRDRLHLADQIAAVTKRPPRYAEYLAAARALDKK